MKLYTVPEVLCAGREFIKQRSELGVGDLIEENNQKSSFDLYLICSPAEDEFILGITEILKRQGLRVFIEQCNNAQFTNEGCSVSQIKAMSDRMSKARLAVYATVSMSCMPWWLLWMLGVFEGRKPGRSAIWLVADSFDVLELDETFYELYPLICHKSTSERTTAQAENLSAHQREIDIETFILQDNCWGFAT